MNAFHKFLKLVFYISLVTFAITALISPPLPDQSEILPQVTKTEPIQKELFDQKPITLKYEKVTYLLEPLHDYSFSGLVVSQHDTKSFLDVSHYDDPANTKDICISWGENISNGAYKKVQYESGDFTCFVKWNRPIEPPFSLTHLANNHVIPATPEIARQINNVQIGDQIALKGKLVNYTISTVDNQSLGSRSTSTTREDTGNGACEVVYVQSVEIIKPNPSLFYALKMASFVSMLLSAGYFVVRFFLPH